MKLFGMILAAGYGKRLQPLTDFTPKPLLPLCGRPLLDMTIRKLFSAGAEKIAVNGFHLADQIETYLKHHPDADRIHFYRESELLDTGGPLINAKSFLSRADAILLHNGDVIVDFDIAPMIEEHFKAHNLATMAVMPAHENRVLYADGKVLDLRHVLGISNPNARLGTYACCCIIDPHILRYFPAEPVSYSLIDGFLEALRDQPGCIGAYPVPQGCYWTDIGTIPQYFEAHRRILQDDVLRAKNVERPFCRNGCRIAPDAELFGFLSASPDTEIGAHARVRDCILLPGAKVAPGEICQGEIIGPNDLHINALRLELEALPLLHEHFPNGFQLERMPEQGSSRQFIRISGKDKDDTAILMLSSASDADFQRFIDYGRFFRSHAMPMPEIFGNDNSRYAVLMEDLGDDTLYEAIQRSKADPDTMRRMYRQVIETEVRFQTRGAELLKETANEVKVRDFDYDYLRWETTYYQERFLEGLAGLIVNDEDKCALNREFDLLARKCRTMPQLVMHRDFQSQNILFHRGEVRYVDFQGMRLGPYTYDLASLLKDPYVSVPAELKEELSEYYRVRLASAGLCRTKQEFSAEYTAAALQRAMQCLGAYGFLSVVKGKKRYLSYVRPGLKSLLEALLEAQKETPAETQTLYRLTLQAAERMN